MGVHDRMFKVSRDITIAVFFVFAAFGVNIAQALTAEERQAISQVQSFNKAFTAIAKQVTPSVVTVKTRKVVEETNDRGREGIPDFFGRGRRPSPSPQNGTGSGIIISQDGYILTNHHVVDGADEITVIFSDNREFEAELIGSDNLTDVGVLKIGTTNLEVAETGDSDKIEIGEWVLAVGSPLDFRSTVTSGIVSAMGRKLGIIRDRDNFSIENFIQTDAPINPGNSGGALVNLYGEVIGVNTAIATNTGTFQGYGFAIPINLAKKVMDDIIGHGRVRRGFLGVGLTEIDASLADAFGLDRPRGVLIGQLFSDTPADKAGLKENDLLLKVDNEEVNRANQVQSIIARRHPGDMVSLEILRENGKRLTLEAELGEKPSEFSATASAPSPQGDQSTHLGLIVQDITPKLVESFGLETEIEGVIVTDVRLGQGSDAGFRSGDVIYKVMQRPIVQDISSVAEFEAAFARLEKGRNAAFSVYNPQFGRIFRTIKIPG